jgi:hypothetical protein
MSEPVRMGVMKHRILKSAALVLAAVASLLVVCWAVSLSNDPKSAQLAFGKDPSYVCLALGKGDLILCDHFDNREAIHLLDTLKPTQRGVAKDIRTALPGFTFRHLTLTSGQRIWSLELSLLIPAMLMVLFSGLFFWMLRMRQGMACNLESPNESTQRTAILCRGLQRVAAMARVYDRCSPF